MSKANKGKEAVLPSKLLKELLRYEYETGLFIKVGQIAGCLCKDGYVTIGVNSHNYKAHRLAWVMVYGDYPDGEQPFIDHINGKRGDNRIENLRISTTATNQRNRKIHTSNTSGITGVPRYERKRPLGKIDAFWKATWCDEKGRNREKNFNIEKLGEEDAKQAAISYRAEQLRLLELNFGIVYSERHGT